MTDQERMQQRDTDLRQIVFPMRRFHKSTGAVKVFFGLDEWLIHERNYVEDKPELESKGKGKQAA